MRVLQLLSLVGTLIVCTSVSCEDCSDAFPLGEGPPLTVTRASEALEYAVGDTVWLEATFASERETSEERYRIADGGGLVIFQLFDYEQGSDVVRTARDRFTVTQSRGSIVPEANTPNPATVGLRFTCGEGQCGFRAGFTPTAPGTYLISARGSSIDIIDTPFIPCSVPSFGQTTITGDTHLEEVGDPDFLSYAGGGGGAQPLNDRRAGLFVIKVN